MIRLVNVNKYFNRRKSNEIHVIHNTSIELANKGLVTFLGPSGCGKTTLLNAIGGLDKVNSGDIYIDDEKMTCWSGNKKDEIRNANVGYIFQNYNLIEDATVYENVALVLKMMGIKDKREIESRVMFVLKRVGIDRYKNRPAKMLSGGERQRVGIARAIVKNPKIIIADEPTGNLDSKNTIEIMNIIKAISREKLVILVTHERELAQFYASRIIEILDGKIISDQDNEHDNELDYRLENKIYLKDMPVQKELSVDGVKVKYYSDNDDDLEVKVVIKNNHIYIETSSSLNEGSDVVELVDDHYKMISKEIYEEYEFNYDGMVDASFKPKYTSIFNPWTMMVSGFKKVFSYSLIKKILLAGFIMASMFVLYAFSNVAGITNITDDEFIRLNHNYLTVNAGKVTPKVYENYASMDSIDYVLPGDSLVDFIFPLDDYYQTANASTMMSGSLAARTLLDESKIIAGQSASKTKELVVDKLVIDNMKATEQPQMVGLDTYEEFIGRKVELSNLGTFTIVGITDQQSPSIYAAKKQLMPILMNQPEDGAVDAYTMEEAINATASQLIDYSLVKKDNTLDIAYGEGPDETYEALISLDNQYTYSIGSQLDTEVNGHKLVVCGFYTSKTQETEKIYVTRKTAEYNFLGSQQTIVLSPTDKAGTFATLTEKNIKVTDNYQQDRDEYVKSIRNQIRATIMVAAIMLLISLIEIYLMLRSSFLSRIKEVGVLRAIGLKKKDIYKMFLGEIVALTLLTTLPGMAVMAYVI
ncbi:MAG: ABC transporter ATP-binding protein/permease, partial [Firmicutes bacterium]|nr:ABC transporter ATP-binding protein/permease [Bacillota bacterium]